MNRDKISICLLFEGFQLIFIVLNAIVICKTNDFVLGAALMFGPEILSCFNFFIKDVVEFNDNIILKKKLVATNVVSIISSTIGLTLVMVKVLIETSTFANTLINAFIMITMFICCFKVFMSIVFYLHELIK